MESATGVGHIKIDTFSRLSDSIYFWVSALSGKVPELVFSKDCKVRWEKGCLEAVAMEVW